MGRKYALYSAPETARPPCSIQAAVPAPWTITWPSLRVRRAGCFSPPYRSHDIFTDAQGRHYYEKREDNGRPEAKARRRIHPAVSYAHNGRLQGILNPAQAETCEPSLLGESVAAAKELDVPIHIHAGGNFVSFLKS